MSIFKNSNESAYVGGRKHWTDVIKNSGNGNLLIWRQPEEDFNTNSTLIVMPGEQAIFVNQGNIEQVFESGTYKLSTENYPFISRLRNAFSGGISTFNCVVFFIRVTDSRELLWGTQSPIQARDKVHNIRTGVYSRGAYKIRIVNPALFLQRIVGNNIDLVKQSDIDTFVENEFQTKIRTVLSKFLNEYEGELIGLDAYLDELSQRLSYMIENILADYGVRCVSFSIAAIDIDEEKYDMFDSQTIAMSGARAQAMGEAMGQRASLDILGSDWEKVKGMEILNNMSENPAMANGNVMINGQINGGQLAGAANTIAQSVYAPQKQAAPAEDPFETLTKLKKMLDAGLITQEMYDNKAAEIMARM